MAESYTLHLAVAALFGASVVAVSAYYMHRKTLTQLLEFAKTIDCDRDQQDADDQLSPRPLRNSDKRRRRRGISVYGRASASLPDVTIISDDVDGAGGGGAQLDKRNGQGPSVQGIPVGLPRLHTLSEGKSFNHKKSSSRASLLMRPISPKSPGASASAFESMEGSDEDNLVEDSTGNVELPEENGEREQIPLAAPSMIRSHSVSGDLHGVQPHPIAADILRKEPLIGVVSLDWARVFQKRTRRK